MTVVMPLGVLANQLVKIEGDLRFLAMRAVEYASEHGHRPTRAVDARLDLIHEALDSIKQLLRKFESDIHPDMTAQPALLPEGAGGVTQKATPERDD